MITVDRVKTILKLAFPINIALGLNLTMALVDLALVGRLGSHATAALGLSVFSNTLVLAFVLGIAPAVQGVVARRRGEGSTEPRCLPLNAGLLIALLVGTPLTIICYLLTPFFFSLISSDPEIIRIGVPYLRILYLAIVAVGMNSAFMGFWTGMEKPNVHMLTVLFMQLMNALLAYALIFGHFGAPALGATGAAIATASSLYVGVVINLVITFHRFRNDGFLSVKPKGALMMRVITLGAPKTLQEFFFSAGFVVFFWLVGQMGTVELAAANVLTRFTTVLVLLAMSLGMASATLIGKTVGEGDLAGAARWGWDSAKLGVASITLLGLPLILFPRAFLSIFLTDPHTISIAVIPLQIAAVGTGVASLIYVFAYPLYSMGDGKRVMLVSLSTQWIFFLPAVWVVGPYLRYGLSQVWLVQAAYAGIAATLITALWAQGRWKKIKI
jgi:putative MATE family efflux protein